MASERPIVAIVGPTAVGKTAVGIALAQAFNGEIISADAVAVYRGLDIGAAKPDTAERKQARFHLIDVAHPDEEFTLANFHQLAEIAIADIRKQNKLPILVGGTGLYVRSVTAILSVPEVPPQEALRARLWDEANTHGAAALHQRLAQIDAVSAQKILPGDAKRIIRALEVWEMTGKPLSEFHTPEGVHGKPRPNTYIFGLTMDRAALYARIEARVEAMVHAGLVDEVRGLLNAGYKRDLKSLQSLGYRQIAAHLAGETTLDEAVELIKRDTRRFAKRQYSWFNADPQVQWIQIDRVEQVVSEIQSRLPMQDAPALSNSAPQAKAVADAPHHSRLREQGSRAKKPNTSPTD